jgi:hypothetical protein
MIFLNFVILCMIRDLRMRKSPSLLERFSHRLHEVEIYYPSMYQLTFSQKIKLCSSGMEFLLIHRLVENQPYRRLRLRLHHYMSRRVCHFRALFHLNKEDMTALYYSKYHHTFCLLNPPQLSNQPLVIGKIAWSLYFGRVFDDRVLHVDEVYAKTLAKYGHQIGDPLSSLVLAMTDREMCTFLLQNFQDKESIYYHIAYADTYLKPWYRIMIEDNEVLDRLREMYWRLKNYGNSRLEHTWILLPGENMWWSNSIYSDAIWALSEMTRRGVYLIQRKDPTMADRLITNLKSITNFFPLSQKYHKKELALCGVHGVGVGKASAQTASGYRIVVEQEGRFELWRNNERIAVSDRKHEHSTSVERIIFPSHSDDWFVSISHNQVKCWDIEITTGLFHCRHTIHLPSLIGPNTKFDRSCVSSNHILLWSYETSMLYVFPYTFSGETLTIGQQFTFPFRIILEISQEGELFSIKYHPKSSWIILNDFLDCSPGKPSTLQRLF